MTTSLDRTIEAPVIAAPGFPSQIVSNLGKLYCRLFHNAISRPVDGKYRCWKCLREFELDW
jgi:hypothetical protein